VKPQVAATDNALPEAFRGPPSFLARRSVPHSSSSSIQFANLFQDAGKKFGVDPTLVTAVAKAESGFDPIAAPPKPKVRTSEDYFRERAARGETDTPG